MLDTIGSGPLLSPTLGIFDLASQAPETGIAVVTVIFGLVMAGLALIIFGEHSERPNERVAVVVQPRHPARRMRRR
jgi:hypothetical protein